MKLWIANLLPRITNWTPVGPILHWENGLWSRSANQHFVPVARLKLKRRQVKLHNGSREMRFARGLRAGGVWLRGRLYGVG